MHFIRGLSHIGRFKLFVTRSDFPQNCVEPLRKNCDIKIWKGALPIPRADFLKSIPGMNGLLISIKEKIDKEALDAAGPDLKVIATMSIGSEHINLSECKKRGVKVGHTPGCSTDATADMTIALLLAVSRRLPEAIDAAKSGGWEKWSLTWMLGPGLAGSTVGIVGFGRIGQAVARRIKAFNVSQILYQNRSEPAEAKVIGAVKVGFDELLKNSDFVICCVALVPEYREVFNKCAFEKMKKTAIFINTSRGGTVDQSALIDALQNGTIRAAGLDVATPEPLPIDNPLFKLKNCLVTPHIGSATVEATNAMGDLTMRNLLAAINGTEMPAELK